jgi:uncharacterized protein
VAVEQIDPLGLAHCLQTGTDYLELNSHILDNLNVFPVPDGDTGLNMVFTMKAAVEVLKEQDWRTISELSEHFIHHLCENSRGNSGFILAQFFSGFFEIIRDLDSITPDELARSFRSGSYTARTSLSNPVEGTMITIISAMAEILESIDSEDIVECFDTALKHARKKILETPLLLPILAKAGVVDSGGLGFIFFIEGMLMGLTGQTPEGEDEDLYRFEPDGTVNNTMEETLLFRFCTELLLERQIGDNGDDLREFLQSMGDSLAFMADDRIIKLHIHTNDPDAVITEAEKHGAIKNKKIDDMQEQISQVKKKSEGYPVYSVLAVIPGEGFKRVFADLGVTDYVLYDDILPTTGILLEKLNRMDSEYILLLPNDGNIIPAASLARDRCLKNISIFPSKNIVEGISAMYGFLDAAEIGENIKSMRESAAYAACIKVYKSIKDTLYGDIKINKGDFFAAQKEMILSSEPFLVDAVVNAVKSLDLSEKGSIAVYYNEEFDIDRIGDLKNGLAKINAAIEFEHFFGGQKKGQLIIAIE